jgi:tetratricopeptide (TPR) repeat protein
MRPWRRIELTESCTSDRLVAATSMQNAHPAWSRAQLLLEQRRYADAERELRKTLAEDPNFAEAHALLAEALLEQQRLDEATAEASLAIAQEPELEMAHYVMACVLFTRERHEEAEAAVRRAIELYPLSRSFGLLSQIRYLRRDWTGALHAADQGLAIEPEDTACLNLRAMALRELGRLDEADSTLRGALESDPNDSYAHANRGWSELHRSRPREALTHFREALRLDPTNDYARAGLVEAMKARYLVYRLVLGYFLWMNRLAHRAQFAIVVGGWIGYQLVRGFARQNPEYEWITTPLLVAYVTFAMLTWLASPLMDLALRLHPIGKFALSANQRRTANIVGGLLLAGAVLFVIGRIGVVGTLDILAVAVAIAALPGSLIFRASAGWPRNAEIAMTATPVALGGLIQLAFCDVLPFSVAMLLIPLLAPVMIGIMFGSQWVAVQHVAR